LFPRFCCDFGAGWERREEKRREEEMREGVKWASGDTHKGLSGPVGTQDKCHFTVPDQTGTFLYYQYPCPLLSVVTIVVLNNK
jgi:hypothetical protein